MILRSLLLLAVAFSLSTQLGKTDRKKKIVIEEVGLEATLDAEIVADLTFPPDSVTKESILKNHAIVDDSEGRKFSGASLAYVTPWNNKGYDLAKITSKKLTHVSPVWLQLKPQTADHSFSCRIEGIHDVDHGWMDSLRESNPDLKIIPRVLFENWSIQEMAKMISHDIWSKRCLDDLMNFLTRNQFDGAVVELWMDVMHRTRGEAGEGLIEFLNFWGDAFHKRSLEIIIPVGPPVDPNNQLNGMFMPSFLHAMAPHVDYIQIMTYDYPAQSASAVAPYDWVAGAVDAVLEDNTRLANKLMIGLNHYGYKFSRQGMDAMKFDQYLDLLKMKNSQLEWDAVSREHFVNVDGTTTYYPSLTSLELRIKLAEKKGVGFAIWDYGQGLDYFSQLL